ncbi:hypothetical protein [Microlunatus elymi]|nr:hypothetical protein [Microlunatus elymi]
MEWILLVLLLFAPGPAQTAITQQHSIDAKRRSDLVRIETKLDADRAT